MWDARAAAMGVTSNVLYRMLHFLLPPTLFHVLGWIKKNYCRVEEY